MGQSRARNPHHYRKGRDRTVDPAIDEIAQMSRCLWRGEPGGNLFGGMSMFESHGTTLPRLFRGRFATDQFQCTRLMAG
jgi:hypothetical protein